MGLFQQTWALIESVVLLMLGELAVKWFVADVLQNTSLGPITFFFYKSALSGVMPA
jgi:hypothetical protein